MNINLDERDGSLEKPFLEDYLGKHNMPVLYSNEKEPKRTIMLRELARSFKVYIERHIDDQRQGSGVIICPDGNTIDNTEHYIRRSNRRILAAIFHQYKEK